MQVVYPVHLNPNVQSPVNEILAGKENVHLLEPQDYLPFIWLMTAVAACCTLGFRWKPDCEPEIFIPLGPRR